MAKTMAYSYTVWNPDWVIGHNLIDSQHQQLIAAVNSLFDAHRQGKGRQEVQQTMNFLVNYTLKHFHDEEQLQTRYKYPDHPAHKQIHDDFKSVVHELAHEFRRAGPSDDMIDRVCVTIGRWIINHIKAEDVRLAEHLQNRE